MTRIRTWQYDVSFLLRALDCFSIVRLVDIFFLLHSIRTRAIDRSTFDTNLFNTRLTSAHESLQLITTCRLLIEIKTNKHLDSSIHTVKSHIRFVSFRFSFNSRDLTCSFVYRQMSCLLSWWTDWRSSSITDESLSYVNNWLAARHSRIRDCRSMLANFHLLRE
jgi:hypothetical protein